MPLNSIQNANLNQTSQLIQNKEVPQASSSLVAQNTNKRHFKEQNNLGFAILSTTSLLPNLTNPDLLHQVSESCERILTNSNPQKQQESALALFKQCKLLWNKVSVQDANMIASFMKSKMEKLSESAVSTANYSANSIMSLSKHLGASTSLQLSAFLALCLQMGTAEAKGGGAAFLLGGRMGGNPNNRDNDDFRADIESISQDALYDIIKKYGKDYKEGLVSNITGELLTKDKEIANKIKAIYDEKNTKCYDADSDEEELSPDELEQEILPDIQNFLQNNQEQIEDLSKDIANTIDTLKDVAPEKSGRYNNFNQKNIVSYAFRSDSVQQKIGVLTNGIANSINETVECSDSTKLHPNNVALLGTFLLLMIFMHTKIGNTLS